MMGTAGAPRCQCLSRAHVELPTPTPVLIFVLPSAGITGMTVVPFILDGCFLAVMETEMAVRAERHQFEEEFLTHMSVGQMMDLGRVVITAALASAVGPREDRVAFDLPFRRLKIGF